MKNHRTFDYPDPVKEPEADVPWFIKALAEMVDAILRMK